MIIEEQLEVIVQQDYLDEQSVQALIDALKAYAQQELGGNP